MRLNTICIGLRPSSACTVPDRNKKSCTTAPGPTHYYSTVLRSNTKVPESRRMIVSNETKCCKVRERKRCSCGSHTGLLSESPGECREVVIGLGLHGLLVSLLALRRIQSRPCHKRRAYHLFPSHPCESGWRVALSTVIIMKQGAGLLEFPH